MDVEAWSALVGLLFTNLYKYKTTSVRRVSSVFQLFKPEISQFTDFHRNFVPDFNSETKTLSKYNKSGTLRKRYRRADLTPIQVSYDLESDVELHLARTQSVYEPKGTFRSSSLKRMSYIPTVCQNQPKLVWIWTTNKQVMTAAVERGWNTFIFTSQNRDLANEWSSIASIYPLFIEGEGLFDSENRKLAMFHKISSAKELNKLQAVDEEIKNVVLDLHWQVIPSETVVAALQDTQKAVFAISKTPSEAKILIEVFEQGLGGVVLKVEDVDAVHELKDCIDRRCEMGNPLNLVKATVTRVQVVGMGDCVCVDLCTLMRPGEGILVGSNDKGLFLVPPECEESNYVVRRAFRVNAGPVHTYVAVPGGKTSYLSELHEGKEVLVVHESGRQRTGMVGRVMIEKTHFILVEAKNSSDNQTLYSILLQNAATVGLVCPFQGNKPRKMVHPVTSLVVGDEVMLKVQGGTQTQNTGVEIPKFTPTQRIQEDATPQRILENASPEMIQEDESLIPPEIIQEDASHIPLEMIEEDASHMSLEIIQEDGSLVPPQIIQEDGSLIPPQIIQEDVSLPRSDEV
ncbi:hypothetical protein IFM89_022387 [Coptis chinensis]|uniref:3-dehydroquinate synthase n=1 Tax=Coptis chinensis TaxID=261450 RepID=A0A835MD92_9MAGN|nr:hypothetical protein IFM89_022387 [Coptis chinensis]